MGQISQAQYTWQNTGTNNPSVEYYYNGTSTKTGLQPVDLQNFCGVPLVYNLPPPMGVTPLTNAQLLAYIRQAEDWVEQNSGILLSQAWVASPSAPANITAQMNMPTTSGNGQILGIDYDIGDAGYDYYRRRFIGDDSITEGWGIQQLRYRPLKQVYYVSFIYPLLAQIFNIPQAWIQQEYDAAFVRIVPTANIQMLPLFALEIAISGYSQNLPGALYYQYVAGLSPLDYSSRYAFMLTLVLSTAAIYVLNSIQGTVNYGTTRNATSVDGLRYDQSYPSSGAAYGGLINNFKSQQADLLQTAVDLVRGGIAWISL